MNDPYKVLGISPNASEDEIKSAYKKLVKKYHPDRYQDEAMAELANEKMTEINAAYDQIMDERKNGGSGFGSSYSYRSTSGGSSSSGVFADIRTMIHAGRLAEADTRLDSIEPSQRNAEWYFLKGTVYYQRGWLNQAYQFIQRAYQMEPNNGEYARAYSQLNNQQRGYMSSNNYSNNTMSTGDCLSSLCIADCCCEMTGGDLIPCC